MKPVHLASVAFISITTLSACTGVPEPAGGTERSSARSSLLPGALVAGYKHAPERSRFAPGAGTRSYVENGFAKQGGDFGVLAVDLTNGGVFASRSSTGARLGYVGSADQHNASVRDYFVGAGMPVEQIVGVRIRTVHEASGTTEDAFKNGVGQPKKFGYLSAIERAIDGVAIAESVAWAQLDDAGRVVAETIYWPDIPRARVDEALTFAAAIGKGAWPSLSTLPPGLSAGRVVIHHTPFTQRVPLDAIVTYDAHDPAAKSARHFDRQGAELRLNHERAGAGPESAK